MTIETEGNSELIITVADKRGPLKVVKKKLWHLTARETSAEVQLFLDRSQMTTLKKYIDAQLKLKK